MNHFYSPEEIEWLKNNVPGRRWREITEMFNEHFNVDLTLDQLRAIGVRNGIKNGLNGQFKKGHTPTNKGTKGVSVGGGETQFKKGHTPPTYRPVGSERINVYGYVEVKISDPSVWRQKHRVVWESVNGPIPKNHILLFGDGNRMNFDINNLILITRRQLIILNQMNLIKDNADLTRTGIVIADIVQKVIDRKKNASASG